jgi:diguanylate cyclase (GGDEF)-like protein/PAS domain S-box-containing protein
VRAGTIYWLPPATDGGAASISTHGYADFLANVHPDDRGRIDAELQQALIHGDSFSSEFRLILADGRVIWVHSLGRIERDAGGEVVRMRGVEMDITARKEAEAALKASERRFRALVQNSSDLITIYDAKGILLYASPSMATILGQHPEEWQGRSALCLVHPEDIRRVRRAFAQLLRAPENRVTIEFRARHADGTWRWLEAIGTNLLHDPSIAGIVANARDITAHKRYAETLTHQAFHDALTGLPNRAQFTNRLQQALRRNIDSHSGLAVFFIDLDRFKVINDSLGHEGGDKLLTLAASRLATHLRPGDVLARFGGDEFAILVEDVSAGAVGSIAERFLAALQAPFVLDGHDVVVDASIGVVVASSNAQDATQLLRAADVAMYEAKRAGRGRWALYDERTGERAAQRLALESELRHAIEQRHLEVHYQPVIELATGRIHGFEALARWRHPTRGLLSPASFMVIAEETGLVGPLGEWVLGEACRQAATWAEMCPADPPLVAVNVSPRQLRCPHFPHSLWRVLGETRLPPHRLELEVTEEALAGD